MDEILRPYRQGQLDALCGVYCVINAMRILCKEIDHDVSEDLFAQLTKILFGAHSVPADLIAYGTDRPLVLALIKAARHYVKETFDITVKAHPLGAEGRKQTLDGFWEALQRELEDDARVAVFGVYGRHSHWTVGWSATDKAIRLSDSGDMKVLLRSRCTLKATQNRYRLFASEVIILRRKLIPGAHDDRHSR